MAENEEKVFLRSNKEMESIILDVVQHKNIRLMNR